MLASQSEKMNIDRVGTTRNEPGKESGKENPNIVFKLER